jgi:hypothetical protein
MRNPHSTTYVLALMITVVIQWQIIESQLFDSDYSVQDTMLKGHVYETYSGVTSYFDCYIKCQTSAGKCYSLNYHPGTGLCELSFSCHLSYPDDMVYALHVVYLMTLQCCRVGLGKFISIMLRRGFITPDAFGIFEWSFIQYPCFFYIRAWSALFTAFLTALSTGFLNWLSCDFFP